MPQIHWKLYQRRIHRHQIRVIGDGLDYDRMTQWCKLNAKDEYLQSWGGNEPGSEHQMIFKDPHDAMLFRLTFGGIVER